MTEYKIIKGKMSNFGGPHDHGVGPHENLALYDKPIFDSRELFLDEQPKGTKGTARRLNTKAYYIACRWNYEETSKDFLRKNEVIVKAITGTKPGFSLLAWPVDWGPNSDTGRIADISPQLMSDLGLMTDYVVEIHIPLPSKSGISPTGLIANNGASITVEDSKIVNVIVPRLGFPFENNAISNSSN